jgi:predicted transcriptional regulator
MKSDWAEALQKHLIEKVDPVPAGWKTIKQISKELGKTDGHASKAVNSLMKLGLAERKSYRALISNGSGRMIPHYRLLQKAKSP